MVVEEVEDTTVEATAEEAVTTKVVMVVVVMVVVNRDIRVDTAADTRVSPLFTNCL